MEVTARHLRYRKSNVTYETGLSHFHRIQLQNKPDFTRKNLQERFCMNESGYYYDLKLRLTRFDSLGSAYSATDMHILKLSCEIVGLQVVI